MTRRIAQIVSALALLVVSTAAFAQAPSLIPMQGYVTDSAGAPLTGTHAFEVGIYAESTGGTALFTDQQMVDVEEGYFTFYVGRGDALDLSVFRDNGELYLGVRIDDDVELSPRTELGTVPFAAYAEHAGSVDFGDVANVPADLADGDAVLQAGSGVTVTNGVIDVDTTAIQARVAACQPGEAIQSINEDGTVVCETDDGVVYTAGTGLRLTNDAFSVDTAVIQARIAGSCAAGESIRAIADDGTVTCEVDTDTDTDTTYSAGIGLALTGTTFSVNTSTIQSRVTGTCAAGQSIRAIAANGSVTCEVDTDTNTTYTAGSGLSLSGTSFSVNTSTIQARVTGTCPAGQSIRAIASNGSVTCEVDTDTDTDTTYTAGAGLSLTGTSFAIDPTGKIGTYSTAQSGSSSSPQAGEWLGIRFRISGGTNTGRLEVTRDGGTVWGTVCDDAFSDNSARVACRAMGYSDGTMVLATSTTDGVDPVLIDDFQCSDTARSLLDCRIRPLGSENCSHTEDVGVTCIP